MNKIKEYWSRFTGLILAHNVAAAIIVLALVVVVVIVAFAR